MIRRILPILFLFISSISVAQLIPQSLGGGPTIKSTVRGIYKADSSIAIASFIDTNHIGGNLRKEDGLMVKCGSDFYMRNTSTSQWIKIGGGSVTSIINNYLGIDNSTTRLISGAVIFDSNFVFHNTVLSYLILGKLYSALQTTVTLSPSDPVYDRYSIIYADTLGHVSSINGAIGAFANIPQVDPASQILLGIYYIPHLSTTPYGISSIPVYRESLAGEWILGGTVSALDGNYTINPYAGSKSTRIPTLTGGEYFNYTDASSHTASDFSYLYFYVRSQTTFDPTTHIAISFQNGAGDVSSTLAIASGSYGFNSLLTGSYQLVAVPISAFSFITQDFNSIRFSLIGANTYGFQIDNITLQQGGVVQSSNLVSSVFGRVGNVLATPTDYPYYGTHLGFNYNSQSVMLLNANNVALDSLPVNVPDTVLYDAANLIIVKEGTIDGTYPLHDSVTFYRQFVDSVYNSPDSLWQYTRYANPYKLDSTNWVGTGTGGTGGSYTASNGLTLVGSDFQLGGILTADVTIDTDTHGISFLTNNTSGPGFNINNTTGPGLTVLGAKTGIQVNSNGFGFVPGVFLQQSALNLINPILQLQASTTVTASDGIGASVDFNIQNTTFGANLSNQLISKWTTAAFLTRTSEFSITGVNSNIQSTLLTLSGNGQLRLNKYGAGTFIGTATKNLAVDVSGNVIEVATKDKLFAGTNVTLVQGHDSITINASGGGGGTTVIQTHTSGTTVTVNNTTTWLVINPASILASLVVTLPASPTDGQEVKISFGGTLTSGTIVTSLNIIANTGQTILQATPPTTADVGETIAYKYNSSNTKWYRL